VLNERERRPPPDAFSIVMASGIVSIAAFDHSYWRIAVGLEVVASAVYVLLVLGFVVHAVTQRERALRPTADPDVALRMFSFVAACAVLASCWHARPVAERVLGGLALVGWLPLVSLAAVLVRARPLTELRDQAHGAWLLPAVATQGLSVTAADLTTQGSPAWLLVVAGAAWLSGVLLYALVLSLIAWRPPVGSLRPKIVAPDSWILMGALAITALAGSNILRVARLLHVPGSLTWWIAHVGALTPWSAATLWIPPLLYAAVWRADEHPGSLRYSRVWWSAVFPIGMYSAATSAAATELDIPALHTVSLVVFWIAFVAWCAVAFGLLRHSLRHGTCQSAIR
jgi:tellurite resistance protein TehA-like permease